MGDTSGDLLNQLREADRERYLSVLFAPEGHRAALAALFLFNAETARLRDIVSEPLPGEIRLQWWREVIDGDRADEAGQHPLAAPLLETINRYDLPATALDNLLEARIFDLYDDPMPSRTDLEGYLGETASALIQMACQILDGGAAPPTADAAGHAGVAYGIANLIRQMPVHRARGQVYLPADLLAAAGTDSGGWLAEADDPAHGRAVSAFIALGRDHLARADRALAEVPKPLRSPFAVLGVARAVFARADKAGGRSRTTPVALSPVTVQWAMTRRAFGF
ncbi:phytoene/squalene synthase family protein [Roseitalea porphyridii]|uniref:Phytoene/squalene synthase family protein n=1 Tax=Roseitalea porphyridii TaxID=1852022 RepID=A0A4P6V1B0_9HYPH|nr:phytoene/squalene synthase family protein [Roseitalea porphyridii]QBK30643.1 phytoene/squalene synthase family protein [Roseitalea porphyridii]